jgi:uncharacterized protein
MMAVAKRS